MNSSVVVYLAIHVFVAVIMYGLAFAYLQRYDLEKANELVWRHRMVAALMSFPGPANLIGVLLFALFGSEGIKYWRGEKKLSDLCVISRIGKRKNRFYTEAVISKASRRDIWNC